MIFLLFFKWSMLWNYNYLYSFTNLIITVNVRSKANSENFAEYLFGSLCFAKKLNGVDWKHIYLI